MQLQLKKTYSRSALMSILFVFCVFMFSLEYSIYLVSSISLDALIKISSLAFLFVFALKSTNRINRVEVILLLCYLLLFFSAALPTVMNVDITGGLILIKYFYMFMVLPILLVSYRGISNCGEFLISTFILIGVLFSMQAILASLGVFLGLFDKSDVIYLQRYGGMDTVTFGIFGFGNAIQSPFLDFQILRPQGWFLEPSKLASFLLLPAFVSIGRYQVYRKSRYILSSFLIFIGIFLTFSLAGYFAVICATLILIFSKFFYRKLKRIPILKFSYLIPIFLAFFVFAYSLLNLAYIASDIDKDSLTESQAVITGLLERDRGGPSGNLVREIHKSDNYIAVLMDSPLGVGFGEATSDELRSGNAFLFWFSAGGIMAVLAIIFMFTYIFLVFCHPLLISGDAVFQSLAASFIGHAIQNLSYGNWIEPYFLLHLALVVMSARKIS